MVKKLLTIAFGLMLSLGATAQWGSGNPTVPQDSIRFWTGTGSNRAVIAVTWDDEDAGAIGIAWGVKWNGSTIQLKSLMDTIAAYDSRLTFTMTTSGTLINNMSYVDSELGLNLVGEEGWWWYNWTAADGSSLTNTSVGPTGDMIANGQFIDWMQTSVADEMIYATDPNAPAQSANYPFSVSNVQYWAGSGINSAVVSFGFNGTYLVYGVRWNGSAHVSDLLDAINNSDSRLTISGIASCYASSINYHDASTNTHYTEQGMGWMYKVNNAMASGICNQNAASGDYVLFSDNFSFPAGTYFYVPDPNGGSTPEPAPEPVCDPIALDGTTSFLETFDSLTHTGSGILPDCWSTTHIAGNSSSLWTSYSTTSASASHSGNRVMRLPDQQNGNITLLVAPAFSIATAGQYQVSLWVKRTNSYTAKVNEGVKVWANHTPDTIGGTLLFHARRSITQQPAVSAEGWYEFTGVIPLTDTVYIVMEGISEYGAATDIDDFSLQLSPNCDDPTDLAYDATTASISWTAGDATQWQVRDGETLTVVSTPSYSNPAWQPATAYTVSVRSICGVGDTNAWRGSVSFTTPRVACLDTMPLPFSTTFSGYDYTSAPYYANAPLPDCWTVLSNGTNQPSETSTTSIYYSGIGQASSVNNYGCVTPGDPYFAFIAYAPYDGTYTTYTNNMNAYGTRKFAVLPRFEQPLGQLELSFDYSMSARSGAELHIGYIVNDTSDFTSLYVVPTAYRTLTHVDHLDFAVLSDNIPAGARLAMLWLTTDTVHTGDSPANFFCGIDNLTVDVAPSCKFPRDFVADSIGYHGFSLSWREVGTIPATQWEVAYGPRGFNPENEGTVTTVSATSTVVSGLVSDNDYDAYVRSACIDGSYTAWAGPVSVHTVCPQGGNVILGTENEEQMTIAFHNWGNTVCQTLYTAEELTAAGLHAGDTISNLSYNWHVGTTARYTKAFSIYMTHTDTTEYPATLTAASWLSVDAADLVFSDSLASTATGLTRYDFSAPFVWNGTDGIAITTFIVEPDGADQSSTGVYAISSASGGRRTVYARRDHTTYTLASLTTETPTAVAYRANILIERPCIDTVNDVEPTPVDTTETPVDATIAASDILYWVGEGSSQVVMAINWADTAMAWGYRFSTSTVTAQDVLDAIAEADPRFSYTTGWGVDDINYIDTAAGMTDTLGVTPGNWWWSLLNHVGGMGLGDVLHNGDFYKWGDLSVAVITDSVWVESDWGNYWDYTYVWPYTITPVSVPDTVATPVDTTETPVDATIAASDILYWVGEGSNQVVLAINWSDTALAWGYRFNGTATVQNMMDDITAADPRLSYQTGYYGIGDILYIDTAAGMTDTLRAVENSWWTSTNNGVMDMGVGQVLHDGDLEKWADGSTGVLVDSSWVEDYGGYWNYIYVYPMTIHPVSVPDTTGTTPVNPQPVPEHGPFCGAVGTEGCNAIAADSSAIVAWATGVELTRGPQNIASPDGPFASFGEESNAIGMATMSNTMDAVSLGDGGSALVTFAHPIRNGEGPDFAVFENAFGDGSLELAFVEVSSDGQRFVRFPATCLTPTESQLANAGQTDPTNINNLAGKFRIGHGTPFDLEELRDSTGINIDSIVYVRIVDVVGSVDPQYATRDAFGHIINDPWPTPFASSGFDLTGVAVLNEYQPIGIDEVASVVSAVWPNPTTDYVQVSVRHAVEAVLYDLSGRRMAAYSLKEGRNTIDLAGFGTGVYMLRVEGTVSKVVKK